MNILKINPYIRRAMHSKLPAHFQINRRIIFDYELLYIEDGELLLTYNDTDFLCKKGDLLLLCPNIPHTFRVLNLPLVQPHIHFDLSYDSYSEKIFICYQDYNELTANEKMLIRKNVFPQLKDYPFLTISEKELFFNYFYNVINTQDPNALECKAQMLLLLQMIISENNLESTSVPSTNSQIASHIKSYIDANYEHEISLDTLERQFDYSKFYIEKLFKQEYGIAVINYRNNKRMEAAIQLLENHSVTEVAQSLGFSSIYSFSRAFRLMYGSSPTKYVRNRQNDKT